MNRKAIFLFIFLVLLTFPFSSKKANAIVNYTLDPPAKGASGLLEFSKLQIQIRQKLLFLRACRTCTTDEKTIVITVNGGDYFFDSTFELNEQDAAPEGGSITWVAAPHQRVRLLGAKTVTQFSNASLPEFPHLSAAQRANIKVANLEAADVGTALGKMQPSGFCLPNVASQSELFQNGKPLPLSRFPNNKGWATIGANSNNSVFQLNSRVNFSTANNDAWFVGFWSNGWADQYIQAANFNPANQQITLAPPLPIYAMKSGQRVALLNTVEYLDSPGEYAIDKKGRLLIWPPANDPNLKQEYLLSLTNIPLIRLKNTQGIQFSGMEIGYTRASAIEVVNSSANKFTANYIRNTGEEGININGGTNNVVNGNRIIDAGNEAVVVTGGDRVHLTPSNHVVSNNQMTRFGRVGIAYHPGVMVTGVGIHVFGNEISDAPHFAIWFSGNNNLIEYNHVHDVVRQTSDAGAFYIGRDWSMRGNIIRYNYFHDLGDPTLDGPGAMGVYLDDLASGNTVTSNLFFKAGRAAFLGGGRDNQVTNNIFIDCDKAFHIDQRGIDWTTADWFGSIGMTKRLNAVNYHKPPYSTAYPGLVNILEDEPLKAKGDVFQNNILISSDTEYGHAIVNVANNIERSGIVATLATPTSFMSYLQSTHATAPTGFTPIPTEKIGVPGAVLSDLNARFGD